MEANVRQGSKEMGTTPVLSYGGGVNSTALAVLLARQGWKGTVIFCDTGTELPETYEFIELFREWLKKRGIEFIVLDGAYRAAAYRMPVHEYAERNLMLPLARARWCTTEYKVRPAKRWCKEHGLDAETEVMVGIAADEAHRLPWAPRPLVEWGITRSQCAAIIREAGLPVPVKSGCWLCPFQRRSQWRFLLEKHPELFWKAAELEEKVSRALGKRATLDPGGRFTLRELAEAFKRQRPLFDFTGYYAPCLCRL